MSEKETQVYRRKDLTKAQEIKYGCLLYAVLGFGSAISGLIYIGESVGKVKNKLLGK